MFLSEYFRETIDIRKSEFFFSNAFDTPHDIEEPSFRLNIRFLCEEIRLPPLIEDISFLARFPILYVVDFPTLRDIRHHDIAHDIVRSIRYSFSSRLDIRSSDIVLRYSEII